MHAERQLTAIPGMGASPGRIEDDTLLRGKACFLDDVPVPDALHACFVRSPHAHARLHGVDAGQARAMPGVVAVYTRQDLFGHVTSWRMPLGFPLAALPENTTPFALAGDEVAFVGEAYAVVVARTRHEAEDAAAAVLAEFEVLPAIADCRRAVHDDAPGCAPNWPATCCRTTPSPMATATPPSPVPTSCWTTTSGSIAAAAIPWKGAAW